MVGTLSRIHLVIFVMATKRYLKIEGIDGSSKDAGHIGEIKILSYQLGSSANQNAEMAASKSGASAASSFSFTKEFDSCSPELFRANVSGDALPKVVLTEERFKRGNPFEKVEVLELRDVLVTSIMPAPSSCDNAGPTEIVVLDAASLRFS